MWMLVLLTPLIVIIAVDLLGLAVIASAMRRASDINDAPCLACRREPCMCGDMSGSDWR